MRKRRASHPSTKRKFYVLTLFVIILVALAAYTTYSKDGSIAIDEAQNHVKKEESSNHPPTPSEEFEQKSNERPDKEPLMKDQKTSKESLNFLLVGVDDEESGGARTDTIMLANLEPKEGKVKLVSIMRDSYVEIPGHKNNKINASFAYGGVDLLKETVEQNFDIEIDYHATVNFDGFVEVVDTVAPDGLKVDIEKRMYYQDHSGDVNIDFQPGTHMLNGEETLQYVRFRSDQYNDFGRVQRQQEVLRLLKDEVFSLSSVTKVPQLIGAIRPNLDTNVSTSKMVGLSKDIILNPIDDIQTLRIPTDDTFTDQRYSHAGAVLELDMERNRQKLRQFFDDTLNKQTALREKKNTENETD